MPFNPEFMQDRGKLSTLWASTKLFPFGGIVLRLWSLNDTVQGQCWTRTRDSDLCLVTSTEKPLPLKTKGSHYSDPQGGCFPKLRVLAHGNWAHKQRDFHGYGISIKRKPRLPGASENTLSLGQSWENLSGLGKSSAGHTITLTLGWPQRIQQFTSNFEFSWPFKVGYSTMTLANHVSAPI